MGNGRSSVCAVILNWNNFEDTAASIEAVSTVNYEYLDVIVVDNGSTDGSGARLSREFSEVTIVQTGQNKGFAGGMNAGIIHSLDWDADYVWLLNNDVREPDPDLLDAVLETFETDDNVGIVTPQINEYPETDENWFVRGYVGDRTYSAKHVEADSDDELVVNDYVPFCSPVLSREVIDELGLLPSEYFLYFEDVDYCTRVRNAGYDIVTASDVRIHHKVGSSSSKATHRYYYFRNRLYYVLKFGTINPHFLISYLYFFFRTIIYHSLTMKFDTVSNTIRGVTDSLLENMGRGPVP